MSHNAITKVSGLEGLNKLKKLSLSHNKITEIPGTCSCSPLTLRGDSRVKRSALDLSHLPELHELRLNDNAIVSVPASLSGVEQLRVLDLGKNQIATFKYARTMGIELACVVLVAGCPCCFLCLTPSSVGIWSD